MYMVRKIVPEMLVHVVLQCSEDRTHTFITGLHRRTDSKLETLLCIIETKCVSEFDLHGEHRKCLCMQYYSSLV